MITLTQLRYIVAVEKCGNFRQAAKACHVTQPTLSMQIQKLEDDLSIVIFDRTSHPVRATPIGQKILEQSRVVLSQTDRILAIVDQAKNRIEGDIRLGVIPTLAPYLLPLFLSVFAKRHPHARLVVEETKTDDIIAALQRNQLDIGLLVTPLGVESLSEHVLFDEPFYVYASQSSHLGSLAEISDQDLKDQDVLLLADGHCLREQTLRICRSRKGVQGAFKFESGSIETLCHLVERGHGYTIIPHLAKSWSSRRGGRVVPFSAPRPSRRVSLVVHHSFANDVTLQALADAIIDSLPKELQGGPGKSKTIPIR